MQYKFEIKSQDVKLNVNNCPPKILALVNILPEFGFELIITCYNEEVFSIYFFNKKLSIHWYNFNNQYLEVNMYDYKIMLNKDLISIIEEIVMLNTFLKIPKYPRRTYFKKRNIPRPIGEYYYKCDTMYDVISRKNCKFIRQKYKELFQFVDTCYSNSNSENFNPGEVIFKNTVRTKLVKLRYVLPEPLQHDVSIWRDRHYYFGGKISKSKNEAQIRPKSKSIMYNRHEKSWRLPFRNGNIILDSYI
jgi:hypothetical protein